MKKVIIGIIAVLVIVVAVITMDKKEVKQVNGKPIIKIGAILPLTKNNTIVGNAFKDVMELRLSEMTENSKYDYEIIFEDDSMEAKKQILATHKLLNLDNVDLIITAASGGEYAAAEASNKKNKLFLSAVWNEDLPKMSKYNFNYYPLPKDRAYLMVEEFAKRDIKKISYIGNLHKGSLGLLSNLKEAVSKYPEMEIIDEELVNIGTTDYKTIIAKMDNNNPDIYVVFLFSPYMDIWLKQKKEASINTPITTSDTIDGLENKAPYEGTWYISDSFDNEEFDEKYANKFGKALESSQAVYAYVLMDTLIKIYEKYDVKPTTEQIADDLLNFKDNDTIIGSISYNEDGVFISSPAVKVIKNGKAELLEE